MIDSNVKVAGAGRPEKYGAVHVKIFKEVVRTLGLCKACEHLSKKGVIINNQVRKIDIAPATLKKYVQRADDLTGEAVILKRGARPSPELVYNLKKEEEKDFNKIFESDLDNLIIEDLGKPAKKTKTVVAHGTRRGRPKKTA